VGSETIEFVLINLPFVMGDRSIDRCLASIIRRTDRWVQDSDFLHRWGFTSRQGIRASKKSRPAGQELCRIGQRNWLKPEFCLQTGQPAPLNPVSGA